MPMNKATTSAILGVMLAATQAGAGSVELNPTTFKEAIETKNAFVKFYAPWCGHCKALAPDWDELADTFASSSSAVVASVDCTADGNEDLCQEYGVSGYPTLKYFKDGDLSGEDYNGGRSLDDLNTFVSDELNKKCLVGSEEEMTKGGICSEKEVGYATKMRAKTSSDRKAQIGRLDKMKGGSMKPELKTWIFQRLNILNGLEAEDDAMDSDEF